MRVFKKGTKWWIDYSLPNGTRRRKSISRDRKLAELALKNVKVTQEKEKALGIESNFERIKLGEFSKKYLNSYCKQNKISWKDDEYHMASALQFLGDVYLEEITPLKIEQFKQWRLEHGVKPSTVNRALASLRCMLNKACEWNNLRENPMRKVKLYKEDTGRIRFLEKEEIERLLSECAPHIRNIAIFALNTGMRRGEILSLKWSCVDLKNRHIYLYRTKSKKQRVVPINDIIYRLLVNIREHTNSEYVFCNTEGNKIRAFRRGFENAVRRAGIKDFHFHDIRHNFASHLVMSGVDLNTVRELLGHSSIKMTLRYAHLSRDHKARAIEALGAKFGTILAPPQKMDLGEVISDSEVFDKSTVV
ncbi:MAG: site-specific integrase [Candidatus Omnitrophica bacterium]|nr:site-specific integrase [Candidatus Omnitrophota bacterium]